MKRKKLIDVFPDWLTTGGIFTALSDMPWSDDITGSTLDIEYYGNVSGEKAVSPLIDKLCDTSGTLSASSINKLVDVIKARYEIPWSKLYNTLSIQYNPLHNFKVETTVTPNLEIKKTPNLTHTSTSSNSNTTTYGGTETVTDNTTETVTDNTTETRTPNLTTEETNEEETIVSIQNTDESRQYGFNSSEAVPTDETEGDITNTTTKDPTKNVNTTTDTGTETVANTGTTTTANTGSTTTANTGSDTNSEQGLVTTTDTGTDTEKRTGTEKTETEGFRAIYGMQSQQVLLDEERKSWLWQFFDVVFRDVDTVLTIPIYIQ